MFVSKMKLESVHVRSPYSNAGLVHATLSVRVSQTIALWSAPAAPTDSGGHSAPFRSAIRGGFCAAEQGKSSGKACKASRRGGAAPREAMPPSTRSAGFVGRSRCTIFGNGPKLHLRVRKVRVLTTHALSACSRPQRGPGRC